MNLDAISRLVLTTALLFTQSPAFADSSNCIIEYASIAGTRSGVALARQYCTRLDELGWFDFSEKSEIYCFLEGVVSAKTDAGVSLLRSECESKHNPPPPPYSPPIGRPRGTIQDPTVKAGYHRYNPHLDSRWAEAFQEFEDEKANEWMWSSQYREQFSRVLDGLVDRFGERDYRQILFFAAGYMNHYYLGAPEPSLPAIDQPKPYTIPSQQLPPAPSSPPRARNPSGTTAIFYDGSREAPTTLRSRCEYKGVMTEEEIAICKSELRR